MSDCRVASWDKERLGECQTLELPFGTGGEFHTIGLPVGTGERLGEYKTVEVPIGTGGGWGSARL